MPVIQSFTNPPPTAHNQSASVGLSIGGNISVVPQSATGATFRIGVGGEINVAGEFVFEIPPPFMDEIENPSGGSVYTSRLLDSFGNRIFITDAQASQPKGEIGERVSLTVAEKDLTLVSIDKTYTFQVGIWENVQDAIDGVEPQWITVCENARLVQRAFSESRRGKIPNDSLTFEIIESSRNRLNFYPVRNYVLYDSLQTEVNLDDSEKVNTSDGDYIRTTANAFPNLTFYKILDFIKLRCGFASVQKDIPDFPVIRADFPFNQSYAKSLAGIGGMYEPIFSVIEGNILRVQTKFTNYVPDFEPQILTNIISKSLQISASAHVDGVRIVYSESNALSNLFSDADAPVELLPSGGAFGDASYSETRIVRRYRTWTDSGGDEVDKKLIRETHSVYDNLGILTDRVTTDYSYDAQAAQTGKTQTVESTVPDLNAVPPAAVLLETKTITQSTGYRSDPGNPKRRFPDKVITQIAGMIAVDAENQALGRSGELEDYENDYEKVYEHGNLTAEMSSRFGAIETTVKTLTPTGNNQWEWRIQSRDDIRGKTKYLESEPVTGDPSIRAVGSRAREYVMWSPGVSTNARTGGEIIDLAGGEVPLQFLKVLASVIAERRLAGFTDGSVSVAGWHKSFRRGMFFTLPSRSGNYLGKFIVESVTANFNSLGSKNQTVTTVFQISEV